MKRIAQLVLGVLMIAVLFAWLILRHQEPLSEWASSSTLVGWIFHGLALLSFLSGAALITTAWPHSSKDERYSLAGDPETDE